MSILTGPEIRRLAAGNFGPRGERIVLRPFREACVQPCSYDVHLGDVLSVYRRPPWDARPLILDPLDLPPVSDLPFTPDLPGQPGWLLEPGRVYLGFTVEYTETVGLLPWINGRSSWERLGLFIHVTAGQGDPSFRGHWTLELVPTQPVVVRPGDRIGQLVYQTVTGEWQEYRGRYQDQPARPVASRLNRDPEDDGSRAGAPLEDRERPVCRECRRTGAYFYCGACEGTGYAK